MAAREKVMKFIYPGSLCNLVAEHGRAPRTPHVTSKRVERVELET